jgi:hypothetical protein
MGAITAFEPPAPSVVPPHPEGHAGEGAAGGRAPVRTEIADPTALPPGTATTKWVAPPRFGTKLMPPEATAPPGVDETMDDEPRVSARTLAIPSVPLAPPRSSELDTAPPQAQRLRMAAPMSKPPSSVEATLAGEAASSTVVPRSAPLWRGAAFGGACFLVGALGMVAIAWEAGLLGAAQRTSSNPTREVPVERARVAVPAEVAASEPPALPPLDLSGPPRARIAGSSARPAATAAASAVPVRPVVVETSNAKPGVGQPVDFAARFPASARPAKVDGALFLISGPGVAAGTSLPASDDGSGVFRTTFTFLQGGRFDVAFTARADGGPAHGARSVIVGDPGAAPPAPAAEAPDPPPNANSNATPNARWL